MKVDNHGEEIETVMVAGSVGIECSSSGKETEGVGWAVILCSRFRGGVCSRMMKRIGKSREWRMIDR